MVSLNSVGEKNLALKLSVVHVGLYKRLIKTFCCTLMDQNAISLSTSTVSSVGCEVLQHDRLLIKKDNGVFLFSKQKS